MDTTQHPLSGVIENSGPDNLRDILCHHLPQATQVDIAVAFVTQAGLYAILRELRLVALHGRVRLVTGLYQRATEPDALATLLRIQEEPDSRLQVRLSTETHFHRKLFLLKTSKSTIVIIGSSNLTKEGLESAGELNLTLHLSHRDPIALALEAAFLKEWRSRSVELTERRVRRYAEQRPRPPKSSSLSRETLDNVLGGGSKHGRASPPAVQPITYWRWWLEEELPEHTNKVVARKTNWDKLGYYWCGDSKRRPFQVHDQVFFFDMSGGRIRLAEVTDTACLQVPTPDGYNYFLAYRYMRGYNRRYSSALWADMAQLGLSQGKVRMLKRLSEQEAVQLRSIINTRAV